jgi:Flp pilus assembly protein CpaB
VLLGALTMVTLRSLSPPQVALTVATVDLHPGDVIAESDLGSVLVSAQAVPTSALGATELVGVRLADPVAAGEVITRYRLMGDTPIADGEVTIPIPLDAGAARWIRVGDRLTLYGGAGWSTDREQDLNSGQIHSVATVVVVAMPDEEDQDRPFQAVSPGMTTVMVLVAADPDEAQRLAEASLSGSLWPAFMP